MTYSITLKNSELSERINEYCHSERNRKILRLKLIDGLTYERIAEIVDMSPRQIHNIVKTALLEICIVPS